MKALITGAEGFVGQHLTAHLLQSGDEVVGIDRADGPDLLDGDALNAFIAANQPEVIYHLGGWSDVGASWDHPLESFRVNAEGTLNIISAARAVNDVKVICISSADVYGKVSSDQLPIGEQTAFQPVTPYASSKIAADMIALQGFLGYGLHTIRVRAFNHLGPGQSTNFFTSGLAHRIAENEKNGNTKLSVGNLTPRRDMTDVRDVVKAYRLLALHGRAGEAYNVCTGVDYTIGEIAEMLVSYAQHPMELEIDPALQRPVETPVLRGDPSKLKAATGWEPTIPLVQTLQDVLDFQRQNVAN